MRKLLLLILIVLVAAIALYRQRLFLRDPLGKMYLNGAQVEGAHIFINYSNDVLVLSSTTPTVIVQNWDHTAGTPRSLTCLHSMACLTPADQAPKTPLAAAEPQATMTDREVSFTNAFGANVRITIR
jgi:galactose mutarotase-like enzyme